MEEAERGKLERSPWKDRRNHDGFPAPSLPCFGDLSSPDAAPVCAVISLKRIWPSRRNSPRAFPMISRDPMRRRVEPLRVSPRRNPDSLGDPDGRAGPSAVAAMAGSLAVQRSPPRRRVVPGFRRGGGVGVPGATEVRSKSDHGRSFPDWVCVSSGVPHPERSTERRFLLRDSAAGPGFGGSGWSDCCR